MKTEVNFSEQHAGHQDVELPTNPSLLKIAGYRPEEIVARYGGAAGYYLYCQGVLLNRKIEPKYTGAGERSRLHTEGGILFANHPTVSNSDIDLPLVMNAMIHENQARPDFSILFGEVYYNNMVEKFGSQHFFRATSNSYEAHDIFEEIQSRIEKGGIFLIFPGTKSESVIKKEEQKQKLIFKHGLMYLLDKLNPDTMVYSMGINVDQARSAAVYGGEVGVSENYSQVKDWKGVVASGKNSKERSFLAAEHFVKLHGLNYEPAIDADK